VKKRFHKLQVRTKCAYSIIFVGLQNQVSKLLYSCHTHVVIPMELQEHTYGGTNEERGLTMTLVDHYMGCVQVEMKRCWRIDVGGEIVLQ
jgi:hypothetical protein